MVLGAAQHNIIPLGIPTFEILFHSILAPIKSTVTEAILFCFSEPGAHLILLQALVLRQPAPLAHLH